MVPMVMNFPSALTSTQEIACGARNRPCAVAAGTLGLGAGSPMSTERIVTAAIAGLLNGPGDKSHVSTKTPAADKPGLLFIERVLCLALCANKYRGACKRHFNVQDSSWFGRTSVVLRPLLICRGQKTMQWSLRQCVSVLYLSHFACGAEFDR